jgi:glyoxylase-like metal-dependent hydrolase (beta-lactamase superfamily II)
LLAALGIVAPGAAVAQEFADVEITTTHVAGNVYMLQGAGGNIGVSAGDDGVLIIDDQFAPLAEKIGAALKAINPGPLKFVLNTHYHGDHTGGNEVFGKEATIIAHTNVRKRLADPEEDAPASALPVVTYDSGLSVHFNGEEIQLRHVSGGHTDSDSYVIFTKANVVHMGDQMFVGRYPFIDLDGGGNVETYIANVAAAIQYIPDDVALIPGHGPLSTKDDLRDFHRVLTETVDHVRQQIEAGKDRDAIIANGPPAEWADWDSERFLAIVHRGLTE